MRERIARHLIVPDVAGLPFHVGQDVAAEVGVAVEVVRYGESPDPEPRPPRPAPPADAAHATPERDGYLGLTDD